MIFGVAFVYSEAFENERSRLLRRFAVEFDEARIGVEPFNRRTVESAKHHCILAPFLEKIEDGVPFQAGPFFLRIVAAYHHDDEVGTFMIELRQIAP
jgi:hypothetical protein